MTDINPYNPDVPHLYVTKIANPSEPSENYLFYHESERGNDIFLRGGVSEEYLRGYLDGATTHQWSKVMVKNGIPQKHRGAFRQFRLNRLSKEKWKELLDGTTLPLYYPYLLE